MGSDTVLVEQSFMTDKRNAYENQLRSMYDNLWVMFFCACEHFFVSVRSNKRLRALTGAYVRARERERACMRVSARACVRVRARV